MPANGLEYVVCVVGDIHSRHLHDPAVCVRAGLLPLVLARLQRMRRMRPRCGRNGARSFDHSRNAFHLSG